ncbi:unnamed protein product [Cyprideis torosa]|uniref:Uncharacterized protein n=1 Tax=Cyprideis torosa TaxID=163714 RepID=A0A7R8ZM94_9CRUS|nr:unnamed protein product [Cyprideis torosa]CAG0883879.1 unnamed protein product [Cyprideis torosa]
MLKHVHTSSSSVRSNCSTPVHTPHHHHGTIRSLSLSREDTLSINSTMSFGSLSPDNTLSSRSSSYTSLNDSSLSMPSPVVKVPVKIYARCLRADIEYKTLPACNSTTTRQLITQLLSKFKMKHRDPNLFYLTMEVYVRRPGCTPVRSQLVLDDDACPAELQSCHPRGESRFFLQMRKGGLLKVYDSCLHTGSQYKSLLISSRTTTDELVQLLLTCSNVCNEPVTRFSIYEVNDRLGTERKLHPDDYPLMVTSHWDNDQQGHMRLVMHRNPDPVPMVRRKLPWAPKPRPSRKLPPTPDSPSRPPSVIHLLPKPPSDIASSFRSEMDTAMSTYDNYFYI